MGPGVRQLPGRASCKAQPRQGGVRSLSCPSLPPAQCGFAPKPRGMSQLSLCSGFRHQLSSSWSNVTELLVNCSLNFLRNDLNKNVLVCFNGSREDLCLLHTEQVFPWSSCVNQKSNGVNLSTLSSTWSAAGPQAVQQQWHCCVTQPVLALLLHKALLAPGEGSVSANQTATG